MAKYNVGEILNCRGKIVRITAVDVGYPNGAENEMMCYYVDVLGERDQIFDEPRTEVFAVSYADKVFRAADGMAQVLFNEESNEEE
jgi:hypothetical protein